MRQMERRQEPRLSPARPTRVTVLGPAQEEILASVADVSAGGMCLLLPCHIPAGSPVKVEDGETLVLADICYCVRSGEGFRAGLAVKHRLALDKIPPDRALAHS